MNKKKIFFDLLYVFLIVVGIWMMITVGITLRSEAKACLQNAFIYGASEQMRGEVSCDCTEVKSYGEIYFFHFNDTDWWSDRNVNDIFSNPER